MNFLIRVGEAVKKVVGDSDTPVVVYSSSWPFMREMSDASQNAIDLLLGVLMEVLNDKTILMPTFTNGYRDGCINLDKEFSTTGIISESFRLRNGVSRTCSAFFSFSVKGGRKEQVLQLNPRDVWGENSLYEWMEHNNARILNFGTHPTHSSYFHRIEWLAKDIVTYRTEKSFSGEVILEQKNLKLTENLFIRDSLSEIQNDFTGILKYLPRASLKQELIRGINISAFNAGEITNVLFPEFKKNPNMFIKGKEWKK